MLAHPFLASKIIALIHSLTHQLMLLWLLLVAAVSLTANAEMRSSHTFSHYTVHYSVFNSTMIQPEIAKAHQLKRANNLAYVNIAVVDNDNNLYGIAAQLRGQTRNLLQQRQTLDFIAIQEQTTTYYLSPIYHNNEDIYHFDITVVVDRQTPAETFTFTRTLYVE